MRPPRIGWRLTRFWERPTVRDLASTRSAGQTAGHGRRIEFWSETGPFHCSVRPGLPAWVLGSALHDGESAGGHGHGDGRPGADGDAPPAAVIVVARGDCAPGAGQAEGAGALGVSL